MNIRFITGEILFWLHLPIVLIWLGLFFIPSSLWEGKVTFHFWFIVIVFLSQILWGIFLMPIRKRFGAGACALTSLTQWVRGYPLADKRNYDHTFLEEMTERFRMSIPLKVMQIILFASVGVIIIQYTLQ